MLQVFHKQMREVGTTIPAHTGSKAGVVAPPCPCAATGEAGAACVAAAIAARGQARAACLVL